MILSKGYLSKISKAACDVNIIHNDITVWPGVYNKKMIYFFGKYQIYFISCSENISSLSRATHS